MSGTIVIEYELLKKAVEQIEKKREVCRKLPSARFHWNIERFIDGHGLQVGNHLAVIGMNDLDCVVTLDTLICDRIGGESTGDQATICQNCKEKKP